MQDRSSLCQVQRQGLVGSFTFSEEIEEVSSRWTELGGERITLVKTPDLRVILVTMRAGAELREHTRPRDDHGAVGSGPHCARP